MCVLSACQRPAEFPSILGFFISELYTSMRERYTGNEGQHAAATRVVAHINRKNTKIWDTFCASRFQDCGGTYSKGCACQEDRDRKGKNKKKNGFFGCFFFRGGVLIFDVVSVGVSLLKSNRNETKQKASRCCLDPTFLCAHLTGAAGLLRVCAGTAACKVLCTPCCVYKVLISLYRHTHTRV